MTDVQMRECWAIPDFPWYSSYSSCIFENSPVASFLNPDEEVYCLLVTEMRLGCYALVLRCRNEKEQLYERIGIITPSTGYGLRSPESAINDITDILKATQEFEVNIL
jgi:hypothetical protein